MTAFTPKAYQASVLASVEAYFRNCHALPSPDTAFFETTRQLWAQGQPYRPVADFAADMPYFCLRVPTGGGKTYLAAQCVQRVNTHLLRSEHSVILWLVPSKAIREQTIKQLRGPGPLHSALREAGPVTVMDLSEARALTRSTLDTSTVVIVSTVQAFNREDTEGLKVYESSGALHQHFEHLSESQRSQLLRDKAGLVPYSLANVLRLRRPFLIVDEAHNSRTELTFDTFAALAPSGILELTATPDTVQTPSNVLHSVSAAELKGEQMIKLPLLLETEPDWQKCLAYALDRRAQLHTAAAAEQRNGAPYLRPLVLIQAQSRRAGLDTLHVDVVRAELLANHGVREDEVVIATGDERGLEAVEKQYPLGLPDPACPVKYVITQQALAEGWDCPSAYILVSMAELRSATSVEQLLGRVLRQPQATQRATPALNQSYAYVVSHSFGETANALRDRLVEGAGFDRREVDDFVAAGRQEQAAFDTSRPNFVATPIIVSLIEAPAIKELPKSLRDKLSWDAKAQTLTVKTPLTANEVQAVTATVQQAETRAAIEHAAAASLQAAVFFQTPAEQGLPLRIPQMSVWVQGALQLFEDPEVLQYPFDLSPYQASPTPEQLAALGLADRVSSGGVLDMNDEGHLQVGFIADLQRDLGFSYQPDHWTDTRLAAWLCRNLPDETTTHESKRAFVSNWLSDLLARPSCDLARANRQKFAIRTLLEAQIRDLKKAAVKTVYQKTLFGEGRNERVRVGGDYVFEFSPHTYAPSRDDDHSYGRYDFCKHYYGRIGAFDSKEEFECACWLDQQAERGRIAYWVRNLVRKEHCSFYLQKADGRFYPDFLCVLPGGKVLAVEYKGAQGWTDAADDRAIGELWAELSEGRCAFVMVRDRNWAAIDAVLG